MIDNCVFVFQFCIFVIGIYKLMNFKTKGLYLIGLSFFLAGVANFTQSENPWQYLFSSNSSIDDFKTAVIGGLLFLILPLLVFATFNKELEGLFNKNHNERVTTDELNV